MPRNSTTKFYPIPDHDGYEVSRDGQVRSCWRPGGTGGSDRQRCKDDVWRLLKPYSDRKGYQVVNVRGDVGIRKLRKVHSLVLLTFRGPRLDGQECCHRDHDKTNNSIDNLYYGTSLQNKADSVKVGKHAHGSSHARAKLTEGDIPTIRRMIRDGHTQQHIANIYNVNKVTIQAIGSRRTWRHVL
jgi:hypothetical protein